MNHEDIFGKVGVLMSKSSYGFSEDWLQIKQILNGMIQLENGEYVTGV